MSICPSVTQQGLDRVASMIEKSLDMGAKLAIGGGRPQGEQFEKGHWFEPTVLTDVTCEMPVAKEEMFAPVMPIITVDNFDEALEIANDREDGLSSYIYTQNVNRIMQTINHLEVGTVFVNRQITGNVQGYHSGQKRSGVGGEDGIHGIENYLQKRVVYWSYDA
ncbi:aldehyde dehydrogenase A [Vibrio astriarenae]|nr:aldehyde dehydrogenase A [Vibrio sp. C7]